MKPRFDKVFINHKSAESKVARRIQMAFGSENVEWVDERPMKNQEGDLSPEEFNRSKKWLYVGPHQGQFFKRCPGARPGLVCCNYFVLNLGLQCDMNCSYCYLQSFINTPVMQIYSNLEDALVELKGFGPQAANQPLRVGTGEVIDSLSLDDWTLYSVDLIRFFSEFPKWRLEFKTKSDRVDQFLNEPHANNVIVSWSLNPQNVIAHEEHGTASLQDRLKAAEKCKQKKFQIAFHLDPMIYHDGWKESYAQLVDEICSRFAPSDVPYISLGALRFQNSQRHMMKERFGYSSYINQGEMFLSQDGKLRYDQSLRKEMFDFAINRFKSHHPSWNLFLCMETPETWLGGALKSPKKQAALEPLFDGRVISACAAD